MAFAIEVKNGLNGLRLDLAILSDAEDGCLVLDSVAIVGIREDGNNIVSCLLNACENRLVGANDHRDIVFRHKFVGSRLSEALDILEIEDVVFEIV